MHHGEVTIFQKDISLHSWEEDERKSWGLRGGKQRPSHFSSFSLLPSSAAKRDKSFNLAEDLPETWTWRASLLASCSVKVFLTVQEYSSFLLTLMMTKSPLGNSKCSLSETHERIEVKPAQKNRYKLSPYGQLKGSLSVLSAVGDNFLSCKDFVITVYLSSSKGGKRKFWHRRRRRSIPIAQSLMIQFSIAKGLYYSYSS